MNEKNVRNSLFHYSLTTCDKKAEFFLFSLLNIWERSKFFQNLNKKNQTFSLFLHHKNALLI